MCYNLGAMGIENFEMLVEQLIERAFGKIFSSPVHWSDLIRDFARAMESHCITADGQTLFPDRYRVLLHPTDWEALKDTQEELLNGVYQCLRQLAQEAGGSFATTPSILLQVEPRVKPGRAEVHVTWTDSDDALKLTTRAAKTCTDDTRPADPMR